MTPTLHTEGTSCRLLFTGEPAAIVDQNGPALRLALEPLAGAPDDRLFSGACHEHGNFRLFSSQGCLAGLAVADDGLGIEEATDRLYRQLFALVGEKVFYRIWNYVPTINAIEAGLEVYRRFSRARSVAFERRFGASFASILPAASAVGSRGGPLALAFVAGPGSPHRFENPRQVPAYDYPPEHGPRSPSFCRALRVDIGGTDTAFISGTAAIRGHASLARGDIASQLRITFENLKAVAETAGIEPAFGRGHGWRRHLTAYVKHPQDLERVQAEVSPYVSADDHVAFVQADICREELLVEIELTLRRQA